MTEASLAAIADALRRDARHHLEGAPVAWEMLSHSVQAAWMRHAAAGLRAILEPPEITVAEWYEKHPGECARDPVEVGYICGLLELIEQAPDA